jgi:hypothetical protein
VLFHGVVSDSIPEALELFTSREEVEAIVQDREKPEQAGTLQVERIELRRLSGWRCSARTCRRYRRCVERASARIDGEVLDAPSQKVAALVAAPALTSVAADEESVSGTRVDLLPSLRAHGKRVDELISEAHVQVAPVRASVRALEDAGVDPGRAHVHRRRLAWVESECAHLVKRDRPRSLRLASCVPPCVP